MIILTLTKVMLLKGIVPFLKHSLFTQTKKNKIKYDFCIMHVSNLLKTNYLHNLYF